MAPLSHRQRCPLSITLSVFLCISSSAGSSDPPIAYKTGTSEVRVSFFATDENNRRMAKITPNDFAVVDGEIVVREFRSLAPSDETPLDIVALVDLSRSIAPRAKSVVTDVARLASHMDLGSQSELSIITFAGLEPSLLCAGDCQSAASAQKLLQVTASGPTPLYDALEYTSRFVSSRRMAGVRQVLLLFSDGTDTVSRISQRDALDALAASGAVLYAIDLNPPGTGSPGSNTLAQLSESTGGRSFPVKSGSAQILQEIIGDLRASYIVSYRLPSRIAGFHSLRILPKHNLNLRFHCRRGYFYEEVR